MDVALREATRAVKQRTLIDWMRGHLGEVLKPQQIYEETGVSSAVLQSVVEKGAARFIQEEVYRDPFTKDVTRTHSLTLTEEQAIALDAITKSMEAPTATTFFTTRGNRQWENRGIFAGDSKSIGRRQRSDYASA